MQKEHRLTSHAAFNYVHRRGKSISNRDLVLVYAPTKYTLRVGVSVSKRIGKAVIRNKVKRRLKEGFRLLIPYIDNRYNYIIIAKVGCGERDYHELMCSMKNLLKRAGRISDTVGFEKEV